MYGHLRNYQVLWKEKMQFYVKPALSAKIWFAEKPLDNSFFSSHFLEVFAQFRFQGNGTGLNYAFWLSLYRPK